MIVIDQLVSAIGAGDSSLTTEIDIAHAIQHARSQRSGLVQTEAQYRFVYHALKHYVETLQQRLAAEKVRQTLHFLCISSHSLRVALLLDIPVQVAAYMYILPSLIGNSGRFRAVATTRTSGN